MISFVIYNFTFDHVDKHDKQLILSIMIQHQYKYLVKYFNNKIMMWCKMLINFFAVLTVPHRTCTGCQKVRKADESLDETHGAQRQ